MAEDSRMRKLSYLKGGCNAFSNKKPQSRPIMFWSEKDIWEYIKTKHLPYSKIYDMGYKRTGCMFCMFGVHMEQSPNRFQYMQKTHPKLWAYCIDKLNLKQVLDYIGIKYSWRDEFSMKQLDMFNDNNKEK